MNHRYERALERLLRSPTRPKLGLDRMRDLLTALGEPHRAYPSLHVAGTKGKGSTCAFVDAGLGAAGARRGLTTSPHLCSARERIAIDGVPVDDDVFADLEDEVNKAAVRIGADPTFFERTVAMAFVQFRQAKVDCAVVEVGLGGRLDATNVLRPAACGITLLGMDHMEHLGDTLEAIAAEKAGIFKERVAAFTVPQEPDALHVLRTVAHRTGTPLHTVDVDRSLRPSLWGEHQLQNASLAVALLAAVDVNRDDAARGIASAVWPGRYEVLDRSPRIILDGAHNEVAAHSLAAALTADPKRATPTIAVVGMTQGRDARSFARALRAAHVDSAYAVAAHNPRAQSAADVAAAFRAEGIRCEDAPLADALRAAEAACAGAGQVVVTGSLYVVGEARAALLSLDMDPAFPQF